ncbi:hypothetical protein LPMP_341930 [Leishmania panamensis]|uniref:Uncharacterized protein n=1 Tax=Leishmania panamensis TaxID=5679 RepID=A0A088S0N9_LEIPA|nr:hypothetical protein LPMP_341930 [Leishmania panamensis]AIO01819.1 hypothetical protein LPMP_341930 [Leishmania panamensis]
MLASPSSKVSLVQETAELLRSSAAAPGSSTVDPPKVIKGIGIPTASVAYPFDVLSSDEVLNKLTVLIVDFDSVVHECLRVLQCCAQAKRPVQSPLSSSSSVPELSISCESASSAVPPMRRRLGGCTLCSALECAATNAPLLPSLTLLLRLFLEKLCAVIRMKKVQAELVLGNCGDSLRQLNELSLSDHGERRCHDDDHHGHRSSHNYFEAALASGRTSSPSSPPSSSPAVTTLLSSLRGVEEIALWLEVYQAVVSFMWGDGGDVLSLTSLYVTDSSGWCGAIDRCRNGWLKNPKTLAQQAFPILCSSDHRAFFTSVSADALLSFWSSWCASETARLCGGGDLLPPRYFFGFDCSGKLPPSDAASLGSALVGAGAAGAGVGCVCDNAVPLYFRHGPSVARRLGLRSSAYLPALYALLTVHDSTVATASKMNGIGSEVAGSDVHPLVTRAAALVNQHCGVLHVDLLLEWLGERGARDKVVDPKGAEQADACDNASDLGLVLWEAQTALGEVSTEEAFPSMFQLAPVWVGMSWKYAGPPRLWCALSRVTHDIVATEQPAPSTTPSYARTETATPPYPYLTALRTVLSLTYYPSRPSSPALPPELLSLSLSCLPLRLCIASAVRSLFSECAMAESREDVSNPVAITTRVSSALSLAVPLTCALADPHIGVVDVVAAAATAREDERCDDAQATPSTEWFQACLTRGALDDVRQYVRPAAQLTAVAIAALWRARLWTCEVCLRFFVLFLSYLESASPKPAPQLLSPLCMVGESSLDQRGNNGGIVMSEGDSNSDKVIGVSQDEVEVWWHAVSCFTVLHSLTTSISQAARNSVTMVGGSAMPSHGLSSIFSGCLPDATYGAADRLAFVSFLRGYGLLLTRGKARDEVGIGEPDIVEAETEVKSGGGEAAAAVHGREHLSPLPSVLPPSRLMSLMKRLQCPFALMDEVVHLHRILTTMAATPTP